MVNITTAQAKHTDGQIKVRYFTSNFNNISKGSIIFLIRTGKEKVYKVVDRKGNITELRLKGVQVGKMEKCTICDFYTITEQKAETLEKRKNQLMQKLVDNLFSEDEIITDEERQELEELLNE